MSGPCGASLDSCVRIAFDCTICEHRRVEPDLTGKLWRVVAEADIRRLALAYADAFLLRDEATMLSLWAPIDPPAGPPGLDASWARAVVQRWHGPTTSMLHVTNHLIWFDHDAHARGRVYCLAQLDRGETFVDQSIVYDDRYVRAGDGWKFETRRHLLWFGERRNDHPMLQNDADWPRSQVGRGTLREDLIELGACGHPSADPPGSRDV